MGHLSSLENIVKIVRYRRAVRWHEGSVDALVFRPKEGIIVTGSEDR